MEERPGGGSGGAVGAGSDVDGAGGVGPGWAARRGGGGGGGSSVDAAELPDPAEAHAEGHAEGHANSTEATAAVPWRAAASNSCRVLPETSPRWDLTSMGSSASANLGLLRSRKTSYSFVLAGAVLGRGLDPGLRLGQGWRRGLTMELDVARVVEAETAAEAAAKAETEAEAEAAAEAAAAAL